MSEARERYAARAAAIEALPPLREVIAAHDLAAQKALGQNFLLDMNITDKIVRAAQGSLPEEEWSQTHVFEIGSGPGGLTRSLLRSPVRRVTAIEFDKRAVAALEGLRIAAGADFEIIQADALAVDLVLLATAPRAVVANLPYNIATPLLLRWLGALHGDNSAFASMTLMFQKEVAQRIVAQPSTKAYGRLAVITQWICKARKVFDLPPSAFVPAPKVVSAVVHFVPVKLPHDAPSFAAVEAVTAAAFQQRRKMIRSSLKSYAPAIEALGLDPQKRAEDLSVAEYIALASF